MEGVEAMRTILLSFVTATAMLTTAARAADLPPRPAPAPPPVYVAPLFTWTGFYIGGNIGGGWFNGSGVSDFRSALETSQGAIFRGGHHWVQFPGRGLLVWGGRGILT